MPLRRPAAAVVSLAVAVAALSACSDSDDDAAGPTTTSATAAPTGPTTTGAATPTTTSAPGPATTTTSDTTAGGRATPTVRQVPLAKGPSAIDYDTGGTYPQLDGLAGPLAQTVNGALAAKATAIVTAFERDLADFGEVPDLPDTRSFVEVAPTATLLDPRLASFRFDVITYVAGAAHPASFFVTATDDLRTGRELALADLFQPGAPYLATIADRARADLARQFADTGPDVLFPEGVSPSAANYEAWWLTKEGLVIGFAQCQATACASGPLTATIPWTDLRDILAAAGPVAALAA
jgi:hypothetical protein